MDADFQSGPRDRIPGEDASPADVSRSPAEWKDLLEKEYKKLREAHPDLCNGMEAFVPGLWDSFLSFLDDPGMAQAAFPESPGELSDLMDASAESMETLRQFGIRVSMAAGEKHGLSLDEFIGTDFNFPSAAALWEAYKPFSTAVEGFSAQLVDEFERFTLARHIDRSRKVDSGLDQLEQLLGSGDPSEQQISEVIDGLKDTAGEKDEG